MNVLERKKVKSRNYVKLFCEIDSLIVFVLPGSINESAERGREDEEE